MMIITDSNAPGHVNGLFVDGNPLTGTLPTQLSATFFNQLVDEINTINTALFMLADDSCSATTLGGHKFGTTNNSMGGHAFGSSCESISIGVYTIPETFINGMTQDQSDILFNPENI